MLRSSSMVSSGLSTRGMPSPNVRRIVRRRVGQHTDLTDSQIRVRALESALTANGYVASGTLDALAETYETEVGPHNGARVVARAWVDPDYRARLFADAPAAIAELGYTGRQGQHMVALENT